MPSELRILRFRLDEVSAAVLSFAPRIDLKVPQTGILGAHAAPDGTPNALLRYGEAGPGIVISNNQLAASLIAYCQITKLLLPREGKKSIQVSKGYVDLRISTLDFEDESTAAISPQKEPVAPPKQTAAPPPQTAAPQPEPVPSVQVE